MGNLSYNRLSSQSQEKKKLIDNLIMEGCEDIYGRVLRMSDAFYASLCTNIPRWVANAHCNNRINSIFAVNKQTQAFTAELVGVVSSKIYDETQSWVQNRFMPLLKREINTLAETVDIQANTYLEELSQLQVSLDINQRKIVDNTTPSTANRICSSGASLLLGDIGGAIMGGAGGFDATLKTMGCEFGAGLIMGIVSLFTPIGLTTFIVGVVVSAFLGGNWAVSSLEEKVRNKVTAEVTSNLRNNTQKENFNGIITSIVGRSLNELRRNVDEQWAKFMR